jgi:hypothetical protein
LQDKAAVYDVIRKISDLGQITSETAADNAEAIAAARAAYDMLTDEQKALIDADVFKALEEAEKTLAESERIDLNTLKYDPLDSCEYDGTEWAPCTYYVYLQGTGSESVLRVGTDYKIVGYKNNINVGTATAIIEGIGKYKGTKKLYFKITPIYLGFWDTAFYLSSKKYVYNGKTRKPKLEFNWEDEDYWYDVYPETEGVDYTVSCSTNRKTVGKHTLNYKFKGNYSGTLSYSFTIVPKGTYLGNMTAKKKSAVVRWKKQATQTTGYQIQSSLKKNFKGAKSTWIKKNKTTKTTIKKLKSKKKYYFRIRTYKSVKGKKYYSSWSRTKTVRIK